MSDETDTIVHIRFNSSELNQMDDLILDLRILNRPTLIKYALAELSKNKKNIVEKVEKVENVENVENVAFIDNLPMTKEKKEYWKLTKEVLEKDKCFEFGRYTYYKNIIEDIDFEKWKILYQNYLDSLKPKE